jgi:hypothetical protein
LDRPRDDTRPSGADRRRLVVVELAEVVAAAVRARTPELELLVREQVDAELGSGGRQGAVHGDARGDRPDHKREDAWKEAEAEHTVFAQPVNHG